MALPGGEAGPGGVLPARVTGRDGRLPALDQPEQARSDLLLLEQGLTALEVEHRQVEIGFGQRSLQVIPFLGELEVQSGDPCVRLDLFVGNPFLLCGDAGILVRGENRKPSAITSAAAAEPIAPANPGSAWTSARPAPERDRSARIGLPSLNRLQVLGQRGAGLVALPRLFLQALQRDRFDVPRQARGPAAMAAPARSS